MTGRERPESAGASRDLGLLLLRRMEDALRVLGGRPLVAAVSGGADSMCLLHLLERCAGERIDASSVSRTPGPTASIGRADGAVGLGPPSTGMEPGVLPVHVSWASFRPLTAVHVDHGLRTDSSSEAGHVQGVCRDLNIPLVVRKVDVRGLMRKERLSMEVAARRLRYEALRAAAGEVGNAVIALGHTADDQIETVLMRILRGTGVHGLAGMRLLDRDLFRPLLTTRRTETVAYCEGNHIPFVQDPSNADTTILRNRIRHELLPAIESVFPGAGRAILRLTESAGRDGTYLDELARSALDRITADGALVPELWAALPDALRYHTLRLLRSSQGREVSTRTLEEEADALLLAAGQPSHLVESVGPISGPLAPARLNIPGVTALGTGRLEASLLDGDAHVSARLAVAGPLDAYLDLEPTGKNLRLRSWRPGDRMRPLGAPGSRKLQDIFTDRKIPADRRHDILIVESDGRIVWVVGVAVDVDFAVRETTRRILRLRFVP